MSDKIREIRAKLDAIAPLPEGEAVTAAALARYFAVRAQERFSKMLHPAVTIESLGLSAMGAEFAAAHALYALAGTQHAGPELDLGIQPAVPEALKDCGPDLVASQAWDAICDGGGIGEWLWTHLGEETSARVAGLAEEMAVAQAEQAAQEVTTSA